MRQIKIAPPPPVPPGLPPTYAAYMRQMTDWLNKMAMEINNASEENDRSTRYGYTITNTTTNWLRTIDLSTANTTQVREFLATLAFDLKMRGHLR